MTLLVSGVFQKLLYGFGWVAVTTRTQTLKEGEFGCWLLKDEIENNI
jgi:hypothetical protein